MQLIAATEVMLCGGHYGTKMQSTIACRLAFLRIRRVLLLEFPTSIDRAQRPAGALW